VRIKLALAAGLLLIPLAAVVALSHAPLVVARENLPETHQILVATERAAGACQSNEVLPAGTSAIRLGITTALGPHVAVQARSGSQLITTGSHSAGWNGASVTIPVKPVAHTIAPVTICFQLTLLNGPAEMLGWPTKHSAAISNGKPLPGRMHIEYLRPAERSWWSMATAVAWRLGLGRAADGSWNVFLVMALAASLVVLSSWLVLRELR
jgi:hypothetical protein